MKIEVGDDVIANTAFGKLTYKINRVTKTMGICEYQENGERYTVPVRFKVGNFGGIEHVPYQRSCIRYKLFRNGVEVKE